MHTRWYGRDTELTVRMLITMVLLFAVYLAFLAVLWEAGVDYVSLLVIAVVLLGVQYYFSDRIVLWSMGARIVSPEEAPELHGIVDRLVALADLPKPQVAIVQSDVPNALATGRNPRNAVVAVTSGLMRRLEQPEVEAVVAHELTHIKNRDAMVITLASFLPTAAFFMMRSLMWGSLFGFGGFGGYGGGRRRSRGGGGGYIMLVYLAALVVWVISFFLIRTLSRYREYAADRGSAIITGAPSQLSSALLKISGTMQRIPQQDLREVEGMNAFFFFPAMSGSSLTELLSTHPSLEHRLDRLSRMQQEMERAA
ncbi:MAG: zinc metalloprotease HtpX [Chloroflexi bacterium]|nr:zinc metalloprotease HtpX [Chloroflexota bacterium]